MAGRRLGQHFLVRTSILDRIAAAACPERESTVIEIGPGKGALTRPLLERSEHLIAVEIDPDLAGELQRRHAGDARLTVVRGDVLEVDLRPYGATVVAGNLPYYITSPIIEKVLALGPPLVRAVFLLQREVAERIAAQPGSRDYGYLSVMCQFHARAEVLFRVPPGAFAPPPKVDSALVRLTMAPAAERLGVTEQRAFLRFAGACFAHKRKTLRNNLAGLYGKSRLDEDPESGFRAEQLPIERLASLYRRLGGV